ncbi:MAG: carboxypeptidase-like regulatory domain-containing protein, partial [Muribaculaceae bacterium]|nr:carboxypeptidase-like regulatory domain-containing protein [Muribaculaceae bacterium]
MNNLIITSVISLMAVVPSAAFAQSIATNQSRVEIALQKNLKGMVVDETNAPIDFANVVLLKADSTYLAGTVTDKDGSFAFSGDFDSPRFVKISSVGYASRTLDIPLTGDLGVIVLDIESTTLGEVVVKSNRPVTAIKGDALVTNVADTQLEHAGTAEDVLVQVPMVVGHDGSFEVFGKGSPAIYINGRLVRDSNELMQISSADIKNVEVVTNPGARYDASINSVIRITTKRPQGDGFSGLLRSVLRENKYVSSVNQANFKYRAGGLEVFANFGGAIAKFQSNQYGISTSSLSWKEEITQK